MAQPLQSSLIIGWNTSSQLRNDVEYPKCLKVNNISTDIPTLDYGDDKIPSNPTTEEVEGIRKKLLEQFKDVISDGEESLKIMNCRPSIIELMPDAKPIRLSTARNMAFGYREETKKGIGQDGISRNNQTCWRQGHGMVFTNDCSSKAWR